MKTCWIASLLFLPIICINAQTASVASPHLDVQGPLYLRQNLYLMNKAANGWVQFGTRNTSTSESTLDLNRINSTSIGEKIHIGSSGIKLDRISSAPTGGTTFGQIYTLQNLIGTGDGIVYKADLHQFQNYDGNPELTINQGFIGIGTSNPEAQLEVESVSTLNSSTDRIDATLAIHATNTSRDVNSGASLGFVLPSNTDGSGEWQQGRILVTPDNTQNARADGRMYIQTRYLNTGAWRWRDNLVLRSSGSVGVGTNDPKSILDINGTLSLNGQHILQQDNSSIRIGDLIGGDGLRSLSLRAGDQERIFINQNGNVGVGTNSADSKLTVAGNIHSKEVKVSLTAGADFVFEDSYELRSLEETENFIKQNKHLPEIESESEMLSNGLLVGEMNIKLLQKIEELTLYLIEQNKQNQEQQKLIKDQQVEIEALKKKVFDND